MTSRSLALQALVSLLALTVLNGATCGTQGPKPLDFEALGLAGLDSLERGLVQEAAGSLACPCHGGHTLNDCQASAHTCPRSHRLLHAAGTLARMGARSDEILGEFAAYEQSNLEPVALSLEPAGCKGSPQAPVTIVAFSDFECPACANLPLLVDSLLAQADGKARFCFKPFPLASHPHALEAAQAAEFARSQGRFWEMHDRLLANQFDLGRDGLMRQARAAGLDDEAMARALDAGTFRAAVEASAQEGIGAGVAGTPTLFINGRLLTLPPLAEFLTLAFEDALELPQAE